MPLIFAVLAVVRLRKRASCNSSIPLNLLAQKISIDCIQSNAWLCRSSVWNDAVLRHAGPECVEDLCKVIAERVAVGFTASPTVVRNWRSSEQRRWSNPGGCVDGSGEASKSPGIPTHACSG